MRVGITGHQSRQGIDWLWTRKALASELAKLEAPIEGWSALAVGADQLFAETVLEIGGTIVTVVPGRWYEGCFESEALTRYRSLLICGSAIELKGLEGEEAFLAAGLKVRKTSAWHPEARIHVVAAGGKPQKPMVCAAPGGPGAARNCGLLHLRSIAADADVTIMFDDDVSFADATYRGAALRCDGARLLKQALNACQDGQTVAGCGYVGRQDLSILEHARLSSDGEAGECHFAPAQDRANVDDVAPGGISTAFLTLAAPPTALPDFPEHYNEDYVWLHAFARGGWTLRPVDEPLIHAPPGNVLVTSAGLSFQIYGEIVWLGILECRRFPVDEPSGMAAAVEEIAGDLRAALLEPAVTQRPEICLLIQDVLAHYDAIGRQFVDRRPGREAEKLCADIRRGLALRPLLNCHRQADGR